MATKKSSSASAALESRVRAIVKQLTDDELDAWLYLGRLYVQIGRSPAMETRAEIERMESGIREYAVGAAPLPYVPVPFIRH